MDPGRWQFWQLRCRNGEMSFVKVTSAEGAGNADSTARRAIATKGSANAAAATRPRPLCHERFSPGAMSTSCCRGQQDTCNPPGCCVQAQDAARRQATNVKAAAKPLSAQFRHSDEAGPNR